MKIAMFASESNPLIKTGGLADVVFSLSKALSEKGHEVIVAIPYYDLIRPGNHILEAKSPLDVSLSWRQHGAGVYETLIDGVRFYLLKNDFYFSRGGVYGYGDDGERFAFFSVACLALLKSIGFKPDVIHCHDWQTGMIPCLLKEREGRNDPFYQGIRTVFTIHNPAFKGYMDANALGDLFGLDRGIYDCGAVRLDGMFSTFKAGLRYADKITTVSPTHRSELLSGMVEPALRYDLELRHDDFIGIVNGLDYQEWDPQHDPRIKTPFSTGNFLRGKAANKAALLKKFNLKPTENPVFGLVSRFSWQKGISLVLSSMRGALMRGARLILLGNGEYDLEQGAEALRREFPEQVGLYIGYNAELAHLIYAGSDFFLMPSLFEPCGISQLIAKRYGALPIVRKTGGLADTVLPYGEISKNRADGIAFLNYDDAGLSWAIGVAESIYGNRALFSKLARNAMRADHRWARSADEYEKIYTL